MTDLSVEHLAQRIRDHISGADVTVTSPDGHHFNCEVIAAQFADLSLLEQHRLVYAALGSDLGTAIHAFSLDTSVPTEEKNTERSE